MWIVPSLGTHGSQCPPTRRELDGSPSDPPFVRFLQFPPLTAFVAGAEGIETFDGGFGDRSYTI